MTVTTDIPASVGTCLVTGRFAVTKGDGPDPGTDPDMIPLSGCKVSVVPAISQALITDSVPPTDLAFVPFNVTTDDDGDTPDTY